MNKRRKKKKILRRNSKILVTKEVQNELLNSNEKKKDIISNINDKYKHKHIQLPKEMNHMDLTINRLKVLGESDIKKLDECISEYQHQNSILQSSLSVIKEKHNDLQHILSDLYSNHRKTTNEKISIQQQYDTLIIEYNTKNVKIGNLEKSIENIKEKIKDTKIKNDILIQRKTKLENSKQDLLKTHTILEQQLAKNQTKFESDYLSLTEEIKLINQKISKAKEDNLDLLTKFNENVRKLELPFIITNEVKQIYKSIRTDLVKIYCKNSHRYRTMFLIYNEHIHSFMKSNSSPYWYEGGFYKFKGREKNRYIIMCPTGLIENSSHFQGLGFDNIQIILNINNESIFNHHNMYNFVHRRVCEYAASLKKNEFCGSRCSCRFPGTPSYGSPGTNNRRTLHINGTNLKTTDINEVKGLFNSHYKPWITKNYKKLLNLEQFENKLKYVVENSTYDEIFELMSIDFDCSSMDYFEFLFFLNFLGTNGRFYLITGNEFAIVEE